MGGIHRAFLQSRHIRKVLLKKSTFWVSSRSSKELELDFRLPSLRDYHSSCKHLSWIPREVNPVTSGEQNILNGRRRLSLGNQNCSGLTSLLGTVSILTSLLGNFTYLLHSIASFSIGYYILEYIHSFHWMHIITIRSYMDNVIHTCAINFGVNSYYIINEIRNLNLFHKFDFILMK